METATLPTTRDRYGRTKVGLCVSENAKALTRWQHLYWTDW